MGFRQPITALSELVADVLRTATSGRRWEIRSQPSNEIVGYTDHPGEATPATFRVGTTDLGAGMVRAYLELLGAKLWNVAGPAVRFFSEADESNSGVRNMSSIRLNPRSDTTDGLEVWEFFGVRMKGRLRGWQASSPALITLTTTDDVAITSISVDDVLGTDTMFLVTATIDAHQNGTVASLIGTLTVNGDFQGGQVVADFPTADTRATISRTWIITGYEGTVDFALAGRLSAAGNWTAHTGSRLVVVQVN